MSNVLDGLYVPTIEEMIDRCCVPHVVSVEADCIVLGNVSCTGSNGEVFEHYGKLHVDKDIVRGSDGNHVNFTTYNAAAHFEKEGMFLPSFALSCNILKTLYENKDDKEVSKVLMQYKDYGSGYGWHAQNTIVDWGNKKIIHYPSNKDFLQYGGSNNINQSKNRAESGFNFKGFKNMFLEKALKKDEFKAFVQDFTGLQQPEMLVEIGKHFNKPAYIWTSEGSDIRAAWLGCSSNGNNYFIINANYNLLNSSVAARGVRSQ